MSLQTVIATLEAAGFGVELLNGKITGLTNNAPTSISSQDAWALIDAEDLRWQPDPDPLYLEWRVASVMLPEFRAVVNEIGEIDLTLAVSILIAFSKVEDGMTLETAIELWNIAISLVTVTPEQVTAIQQVCDAHYVQMVIAENGQASLN